MATVVGKVRKRAGWIRRQQRFFREFLPKMPPRRYVSGETHRYLGRQYRLKVVEGGEPGVKLKGRFIWISVPQKSSQGVRRLVERWYLERAKDRLSRSFDRGLERMGKVLAVAPALRIRRMLKRWGSWTRRSGVCLNPELVKAPGSCIDYVVIHELCHAVHGHHGKEFYDLQRRIMPDWEQRKARLEQVGAEAGIASEMKTY